MNRIIFLIFSAVLALGAYAQQFTATGVVSSEKDGELLPGVTVRVKGQKTGTATDIDGRFSIKVNKGAVLEFSYIGYQSAKEKAVEGTFPESYTKELAGKAATFQCKIHEVKETIKIGRASCRERV